MKCSSCTVCLFPQPRKLQAAQKLRCGRAVLLGGPCCLHGERGRGQVCTCSLTGENAAVLTVALLRAHYSSAYLEIRAGEQLQCQDPKSEVTSELLLSSLSRWHCFE